MPRGLPQLDPRDEPNPKEARLESTDLDFEVEIQEDQLDDNPVVRRAKLIVYKDGSVRLRVWKHPGAPSLAASQLYLKAQPVSVLLTPYD